MKSKKNDLPTAEKQKSWPLLMLLSVFACIVLFIFGMRFSAATVKVRYAEVVIEDLPEGFDGTTLLYISDIDLCGLHNEQWFDKLCSTLRPLSPDIIAINGSFYSLGWAERLNGKTQIDTGTRYDRLFSSLSEIPASLGRCFIRGEQDADSQALALLGNEYGFTAIELKPLILNRGNDSIALVGVPLEDPDVSSLASSVTHDKCVITLMHSPEQSTSTRIQEAKDGGSWTDLILTGHTHGGLVSLFGSHLLSLSERETTYRAGWYTDGGQPMLVSSGLGTHGWGIRLGSQNEVWMLKLRTATSRQGDPLVLTLDQ